MEFISTEEAAAKWNVGKRRVQTLCIENKISGAVFIGRQWMIPIDAPKPVDGRLKSSRSGLISNNFGQQYHFPVLILSRYYSHRSVLNEDELFLLDAQEEYLKGNYFQSIKKCRLLINDSLLSSVIFGAYATIVACCIPSGLSHECISCIDKMKKLAKSDNLHSEDYKLIIGSLEYHITQNPKEALSVDINRISPDSMDYYMYILLMSKIVNKIGVTLSDLSEYEIYCKKIDLEQIDPCSFVCHTLVGTLFFYTRNENKCFSNIKQALLIAKKNNWIGFFAKFLLPFENLFSSVCDKDSLPFLSEAKKYGLHCVGLWKKFIHSNSVIILYKNADPCDYEILLLIGSGRSIDEISIFLGHSKKEIQQKMKRIYKTFNVHTKRELLTIIRKTNI